jgi:hypothetical protein
MKTFILPFAIIFFSIPGTIFGQDRINNLPDDFYGDWVEDLAQCEISPILRLEFENGELLVSGYEWGANEVKVQKMGSYFLLLMKGYSEGEEFESEMKIRMGNDGNLILLDSEAIENRLIRCK